MKAILCYERALKGNPVPREGLSRQSCATRELLNAILCSERPFEGQPVLRAAGRGAHPRICREPGRSPLKLYQKLYKIRRPSKTGIRSALLCCESPWCLPGSPNGSLLPPWCFAGCPSDPSCLPGASLVPPKLSKSFLPASLCLAGCPNDPFLPPWCLASSPMNPFLPPWCLSGCPNGPFLPPWCLPVKGNPVLRAPF